MSKPKAKKRRPEPKQSTMEIRGLTPCKPPKPTQADVERAAARSEIEQAATQSALLAQRVVYLRRDIEQVGKELDSLKSQLSTTMLQHQEAVTKLNALALIPQPVP